MKRSIHWFVSALFPSMFVAIFFPLILMGQSKSINAEKIIKESEVIVQGKVGGRTTEWTAKHDKIQTRVIISVDQTLKGAVPGSTITVVVPGGEIDGVGEWYSHVPRFEDQEEVVLFARQDKAGAFKVAGGEAGKFTVVKDAKTGSKIIANVGTLESFTSKIKNTIKLQRANAVKEQ
jgi:hypothetical protein